MRNPLCPWCVEVDVTEFNVVNSVCAEFNVLVIPIGACLAEFIVGGITNGADTEVNIGKGRLSAADRVPKRLCVVWHLAFAPCRGDDEGASVGVEFACVISVHIVNSRDQAIVGCHPGGLFCKSGCVSSLRPEEDCKASVAAHERLECLGSTGCNCGSRRCFDCELCSGRCFNRCFHTIAYQFEFDDLNRASLGCFKDHLSVISTKGTHHWGAPDVSVELTIRTDSSKNLRRIIIHFEDFRTDILTRITGDAIFVNPHLCHNGHVNRSHSRRS